MARCSIKKPSKLRRISALLSRQVRCADCRGGNDHYFRVFCMDGTVWHVKSDMSHFEQDFDWEWDGEKYVMLRKVLQPQPNYVALEIPKPKPMRFTREVKL
jgi:hypothetical protein